MDGEMSHFQPSIQMLTKSTTFHYDLRSDNDMYMYITCSSSQNGRLTGGPTLSRRHQTVFNPQKYFVFFLEKRGFDQVGLRRLKTIFSLSFFLDQLKTVYPHAIPRKQLLEKNLKNTEMCDFFIFC